MKLLEYLFQFAKSTRSLLATGSLFGLLLITFFSLRYQRWDIVHILISGFFMVFVYYFKKDGTEVVNKLPPSEGE